MIPPWPSVAAGALRSRILVDDSIDLAQFASGKASHPQLGRPGAPGSFRLTRLQLARRLKDGKIEPIYPLPADLILKESASGEPHAFALQPGPLPTKGIESSSQLPLLPQLAESDRSKAVGGYLLTAAGWQSYLSGKLPEAKQLIAASRLYQRDYRVGIGLSLESGSAESGKLFSSEAIALADGIGLLVDAAGCKLPDDGLLRFGGDGRGMAVHPVDKLAEPDIATTTYDAIVKSRRCRLVLTTPAIFDNGWLPASPDGNYRITIGGIRARLAAAAVPRYEVVSGWDLARSCPKAAQRSATTGSVYWLDEIDGSSEALSELCERGLWQGEEELERQAEGFNRFALAQWESF